MVADAITIRPTVMPAVHQIPIGIMTILDVAFAMSKEAHDAFEMLLWKKSARLLRQLSCDDAAFLLELHTPYCYDRESSTDSE